MTARRIKGDLTEAERAVLELSAGGAVARDISLELGRPESEVREILRHTITVLGASSKLEAVLIALEHDLIDPWGDRARAS
jgi:DNA-binding NarL/FixJ family response regulator